MPGFGLGYTSANSMEPTCNIFDLTDDSTTECDTPSESTTDAVLDSSCYISDSIVNDDSIIICDTPPRRSARVTNQRLQNKRHSKNNGISNSPNNPILIADQSTAESNSNRDVASSSDSRSQRTSLDSHICPLCLETFKEIQSRNIGLKSTLCGHIFCETCVAKYHSKKCPVCCKRMKPNQFINLFL